MADRRSHLRYQVLGAGGASALATEQLRMVNLGPSGVLVEAPFPLMVNAEYVLQLVLPSHVSQALVKVRRVAPDSGPAAARYYIGFEFLSLSPEAEEAVGRIVSQVAPASDHRLLPPQERRVVEGAPERRRSPRGVAGELSWLAMPSTWRVQLIDVSLGGVAFTSPYALEVGRVVSMRATLGREALNVQVRICWSRPRTTGGGVPADHEVGAAFQSIEESSRRALHAFLKCPPLS
jgi:c-di-GMP-binding flagellar brake protein YcgR